MSTITKKPKPRAPQKRANVRRASASKAAPTPAHKGDVARAMFSQWDKEHRDPRPISWKKLKTTLEENRLREAPLFSE